MIDQKILDELEEIYKIEQIKNGFKLHTETEIGSADILFLKCNNNFRCGYKITNPNGKIIEERVGEFGKKRKYAQRYLVRICFKEIYSKLGLNN